MLSIEGIEDPVLGDRALDEGHFWRGGQVLPLRGKQIVDDDNLQGIRLEETSDKVTSYETCSSTIRNRWPSI